MSDWNDEAIDEAVRDWAKGRGAPEPLPADVDALIAAARSRRGSRGQTLWLALAALVLLGLGVWLNARPSSDVLPVASAPPEAPMSVEPAPDPVGPALTGLALEPRLLLGTAAVMSADALESEERIVAELGADRVALMGAMRVQTSSAEPGNAARTRTRLVLQRGTVAMEVAPREADGAFVVAAGDLEVTVVGTRFGVERGVDGGIRVTVEEGRVSVALGVGHAREDWSLRAGERLMFGPEGVRKESHASAEVTEMLAVVSPEDVEVEEPALSSPRPRPEAAPDRATRLTFLRRQLLAGDLSGARGGLQVLAEEHPEDVAILSLLATAQRKGGEVDAAAATLERAASLGGTQASRFTYEAASLHDSAGRPERVVALLEPLLGLLPAPLQPDARLRLGRAMIATGRTGDGRAELEELVRRYPGTGAAQTALSMLSEESL